MSDIVAFMQNPWFKPGTDQYVIDRYTNDQEFHRRLLALSMSGKRLHQVFGEDLLKKIWWDNANPIPVFEPAGKQPADMDHMASVLDKQKPKIVITFGGVAREAMEVLANGRTLIFMCCHHPNARHKTNADLMEFANKVRRMMEALNA